MKRKDFHMIEPDRDIILHCDDFMGDYKVEGQMVFNKHYKKNRFYSWNEGKLESDYKNWMQREYWEYK